MVKRKKAIIELPSDGLPRRIYHLYVTLEDGTTMLVKSVSTYEEMKELRGLASNISRTGIYKSSKCLFSIKSVFIVECNTTEIVI